MVSSGVLTVEDETLVVVPEAADEEVVALPIVAIEVAAVEVATASQGLAPTVPPTPGGLARPGTPIYPPGGPVKNISFGGSQLTGVRNPILVLGKNSPHPRTKIETGTSPL